MWPSWRRLVRSTILSRFSRSLFQVDSSYRVGVTRMYLDTIYDWIYTIFVTDRLRPASLNIDSITLSFCFVIIQYFVLEWSIFNFVSVMRDVRRCLASSLGSQICRCDMCCPYIYPTFMWPAAPTTMKEEALICNSFKVTELAINSTSFVARHCVWRKFVQRCRAVRTTLSLKTLTLSGYTDFKFLFKVGTTQFMRPAHLHALVKAPGSFTI
jgi:hypothetical protein